MIELLVIDVDGTLTDGKIIYSNSGEELKNFHVRDGFAIVYWTKQIGKKAAIITGRNSKIVENRAKELGFQYCVQGVKDKLAALEEILKKENLTFANVAVIGDDLNDLSMMEHAKLSFCPSDASEYILDTAKIVSKYKGGEGAVREMIEYVLRYQDMEEEFISRWV